MHDWSNLSHVKWDCKYYIVQGPGHITILVGPKFLLSDQAMCLWFIKKPPKYGRFSVLDCTFQGQ